MSLQEALKRMRLELGLTQMDLAKKLNRAFITVNRWENGRGFPSRENARAILSIAKSAPVSQDCYAYLNETLLPDAKRSKSAAQYGYPDIDRDTLFQLADGSINVLYLIEAGTYRLLYANRQAEKFAVDYLALRGQAAEDRRLAEETDKRCFHYFGGRDTPCPFCPLDRFGTEDFSDVVVTIPQSGRTLRTHAKRLQRKGRDIYAIYLDDITDRAKS